MSRRLLMGLVAAASWLLTMLAPAPVAAAILSELRPLDLRLESGAGAWHTADGLRLIWNLQQADGAPAPTTIHYRTINRTNGAVDVGNRPWAGDELNRLPFPAGPGRYTVEVWLQSPRGTGPSASTELLFDDTPPQPPRPVEPTAWARADAGLGLRIEPPSGPQPQPQSGIRGYAVSVDRRAISSPCQLPDRCGAEEIDLPFGEGPMTAPLGVLPEGVNVAHVVAVSGTGVPSPVRSVNVRVDASPPIVALGGAPGNWAKGPVRLTASATDSLSGMGAGGPSGPFTAIAVDRGPPTVSPGALAATTVLGEGVHTVSFHARDAAGNVSDEQAGAAGAVSTLVRIDATPPRVGFVPAQDPAEPERIEATVEDSLSGPSGERGSIWFRAAHTRRQFQPIPTAVVAGKLIARWDSDSQAPGSYEFRAVGYDAAGNSAGGGRRANGTRMVLANPLKRTTALQLGFGGRLPELARRPATRSLTYGRSVLVGGRLASGSAPLPGQPVELVETFAAGADLTQRSTIAITGEDGIFLARLAPGPSRRIEARFAGNRVLTRTGGRHLGLTVPSAVRLRSSTGSAVIGGRPVIFSGRIGRLDATIPPTGLAVELQFRIASSDWNEFRTVQSNHRGRFRYPYAFSDDDSRGARFQFRAFLPAQPDWPYEPAASHPVIVMGR